MTKFVKVDKVAEALRISERVVQRRVIYDGMPRNNRGEYDLDLCLAWYAKYLHKKVCGCAGPCDGFDHETRNLTNSRAERRKALEEISELAPNLVGLKAETIKKRLNKIIDKCYPERVDV